MCLDSEDVLGQQSWIAVLGTLDSRLLNGGGLFCAGEPNDSVENGNPKHLDGGGVDSTTSMCSPLLSYERK